MKPSERIKQLAVKSAKDNPNNKIFSVDYIMAIMDYLDEEYEREKESIEDLIA